MIVVTLPTKSARLLNQVEQSINRIVDDLAAVEALCLQATSLENDERLAIRLQEAVQHAQQGKTQAMDLYDHYLTTGNAVCLAPAKANVVMFERCLQRLQNCQAAITR